MPEKTKKKTDNLKTYPLSYALINELFKEIVLSASMRNVLATQYSGLSLIYNRKTLKNPGNLPHGLFESHLNTFTSAKKGIKTTLKIQAKRGFFQELFGSIGTSKLEKMEKFLKNSENFKLPKELEGNDKPPLKNNLEIKLTENKGVNDYIKYLATTIGREGRNLADNIASKVGTRHVLGTVVKTPGVIWSHSDELGVWRGSNIALLIVVFLAIVMLGLPAYSLLARDELKNIEILFFMIALIFLGGAGVLQYKFSKLVSESPVFTTYSTEIIKSTLGTQFGLSKTPIDTLFPPVNTLIAVTDSLAKQYKIDIPDIGCEIVSYLYERGSGMEKIFFYNMVLKDIDKKEKKEQEEQNENKNKNKNKNENENENKNENNMLSLDDTMIINNELPRSLQSSNNKISKKSISQLTPNIQLSEVVKSTQGRSDTEIVMDGGETSYEDSESTEVQIEYNETPQIPGYQE